jgi:hypothetical protein
MSTQDVILTENPQGMPPQENTGAQEMELPDGAETFFSKSPTVGKLFGALAKAQLKYKPIFKDTPNPYYNSVYADLASIIEATQQALAEEGLVLVQTPIVDMAKQKAGVASILGHSSGEYLRTELILPATMKGKDGNPRFDAQSVGSAITYARRYSYQPLVGVAGERDDDANTASVNGSKEAQAEVVKQKLERHARGEKEPVLNWTWFDESQTAKITGDEGLLKANRDILKHLWDAGAKAIIANGDQLEDLKFQFEQRGVLFQRIKP